MSITQAMRSGFYAAVTGLLLSAAAHSHQGTPNLGASAACAEQSLGDACEWSDAHNALYVGSCRRVTSSLHCVRNKPIIYPEDKSADHKGAGH